MAGMWKVVRHQREQWQCTDNYAHRQDIQIKISCTYRISPPNVNTKILYLISDKVEVGLKCPQKTP